MRSLITTHSPSSSMIANKENVQTQSNKINKRFSVDTRQSLENWFELNRENPFMSTLEMERLSNLLGITEKQISKWLANKRNRSKNKSAKVKREQRWNIIPSRPLVCCKPYGIVKPNVIPYIDFMSGVYQRNVFQYASRSFY
ncbi:hypothetical protein ACOME3_005125 [Neoechinorhynchus agilis]